MCRRLFRRCEADEGNGLRKTYQGVFKHGFISLPLFLVINLYVMLYPQWNCRTARSPRKTLLSDQRGTVQRFINMVREATVAKQSRGQRSVEIERFR